MTGSLIVGSGVALWLGILTSISPCPLATNIVAVAFVSRKVSKSWLVLASGLLYALGRMLAYLVISSMVVKSIFSISLLSNFFQQYMNKLLGPVLILAGIFMLELFSYGVRGEALAEKLGSRLKGAGIWGSAALGMVFALSFCPVSAALFFGSLIPLALKYQSELLLPSVYGLGTAVPVIAFALALAAGIKSVSKMFDKLSRIEKWARGITGLLFIAIGVYYCLKYIFGLFA